MTSVNKGLFAFPPGEDTAQRALELFHANGMQADDEDTATILEHSGVVHTLLSYLGEEFSRRDIGDITPTLLASRIRIHLTDPHRYDDVFALLPAELQIKIGENLGPLGDKIDRSYASMALVQITKQYSQEFVDFAKDAYIDGDFHGSAKPLPKNEDGTEIFTEKMAYVVTRRIATITKQNTINEQFEGYPEWSPMEGDHEGILMDYKPYYPPLTRGGLERYKNAGRLDLVYYEGATMPKYFFEYMARLQHFELESYHLKTLPPMSSLRNLQELHIHDTRNLEQLPPSITELQALQSLKMQGCALTSIPDLFQDGKLPNLSLLDLRENQLEDLPRSVWEAEQLHTLLVRDNPITSLPESMRNFAHFGDGEMHGLEIDEEALAPHLPFEKMKIARQLTVWQQSGEEKPPVPVIIAPESQNHPRYSIHYIQRFSLQTLGTRGEVEAFFLSQFEAMSRQTTGELKISVYELFKHILWTISGKPQGDPDWAHTHRLDNWGNTYKAFALTHQIAREESSYCQDENKYPVRPTTFVQYMTANKRYQFRCKLQDYSRTYQVYWLPHMSERYKAFKYFLWVLNGKPEGDPNWGHNHRYDNEHLNKLALQDLTYLDESKVFDHRKQRNTTKPIKRTPHVGWEEFNKVLYEQMPE